MANGGCKWIAIIGIVVACVIGECVFFFSQNFGIRFISNYLYRTLVSELFHSLHLLWCRIQVIVLLSLRTVLFLLQTKKEEIQKPRIQKLWPVTWRQDNTSSLQKEAASVRTFHHSYLLPRPKSAQKQCCAQAGQKAAVFCFGGRARASCCADTSGWWWVLWT